MECYINCDGKMLYTSAKNVPEFAKTPSKSAWNQFLQVESDEKNVHKTQFSFSSEV